MHSARLRIKPFERAMDTRLRSNTLFLFQTPTLEPSVPYSQTFGIIVSYECPEDRSSGNYQEDLFKCHQEIEQCFPELSLPVLLITFVLDCGIGNLFLIAIKDQLSTRFLMPLLEVDVFLSIHLFHFVSYGYASHGRKLR